MYRTVGVSVPASALPSEEEGVEEGDGFSAVVAEEARSREARARSRRRCEDPGSRSVCEPADVDGGGDVHVGVVR